MNRLIALSWSAAFVITQSVGIMQAADPDARERNIAERESFARASELVGQSLQAEVDGDFSGRERFLNEALEINQSFAPIHWYRGKVMQGDRSWITVNEAIEKAKTDDLLAEYEAMRAQQPASVQGNWQAAIWCAKKNMPLQCRAHLENILMLDHDNVTARKALGHQLVGNDWLTPNDQFMMAAKAKFAQAGYSKYQKTINALVGKARNARGTARDSAMDELKSIDDPLAIPVMESIVGLYEKELSILAVNWLGSMDHEQTAASLARIALFVEDQQIRQAAVTELKNKSLFDFIPELLSAMSSPIVFQSVPVILPNGTLAGFRQAYAKEGMESFQLLNADVALKYVPVGVNQFTIPNASGTTERTSVIGHDPTQAFGQRYTFQTVTNDFAYSDQRSQDVSDANAASAYAALVCKMVAENSVIAEVQGRKTKAEQENKVIADRNRRISTLISDISNKEFVNVPHDVWQWWDKYNETNYQRYKFKRYKNEETQYKLPTLFSRSSYANPDVNNTEYRVFKASCFVAGTKINTLRGLVDIEKIMPGDLVLSRDVYTGELCYKPVICGTTRDPSKTVVLKVDDDTIHSTTSHLLWVSGKGWTKAGEIIPGQLLHATAEPAVVMNTTPGAVLPTYNLIVADTHTYFVGSSRVLSHDVLPRGSVHELVPGESLYKH